MERERLLQFILGILLFSVLVWLVIITFRWAYPREYLKIVYQENKIILGKGIIIKGVGPVVLGDEISRVIQVARATEVIWEDCAPMMTQEGNFCLLALVGTEDEEGWLSLFFKPISSFLDGDYSEDSLRGFIESIGIYSSIFIAEEGIKIGDDVAKVIMVYAKNEKYAIADNSAHTDNSSLRLIRDDNLIILFFEDNKLESIEIMKGTGGVK